MVLGKAFVTRCHYLRCFDPGRKRAGRVKAGHRDTYSVSMLLYNWKERQTVHAEYLTGASNKQYLLDLADSTVVEDGLSD